MNFVGIAVAGIVNFILGGVWYALFGNAWLRALGKTKEDLKPGQKSPYIIAFIGSFLNALGLSLVLSCAQVPSLGTAVGIGAGAAVLLILATGAKHYAFSGWSLRLFAIDYGLDFVGFVVMSIVLFMFGL